MAKFNFGNAFKEFLDGKLAQELDDVRKLFFDADGILKNGNTMEGFTQWTYGIRKEHTSALKNPEKLSALRKEFISSKLKNSNKNLRPTATINGNNVEINSIYNHSAPKSAPKKSKPQKTYDSWFKQMRESGIDPRGQGDNSFSRVQMDERGYNTPGFANTGDKELMSSWAMATDEEINAYGQRLLNEGYSKKDIIEIKERMKANRTIGRSRTVKNWLKSSTKGNNGFKNVTYKGQNYFLLNEGKVGGLTADSPVTLFAINAETGEHVDFGKFFYDENAIDPLNNTDYWYDVINEIEDNGYVTSQEMQEIINANMNRNVQQQTGVDTQQHQQTSQPEVQQQVEQRQYNPDLSPEEQAAVDRANEQWRADNEVRYADMDKQIENMYKADDIVFGTPEQILDPNYVSSFDPLEETIESTMNTAEETIKQTSKSVPRRKTGRQTGRYAKQRNAERQNTKNRGRSGNAKGKTGPTKSINELHQEANQRKWANEQYAKQQAEQLNKYKQTYEDILDDWKKTSGDFSSNLDNRNLKMPDRLINNGSNSHQMYTEAGDYYKYVEDANTDYYRERYTDGSYTMDEQVFKYTEGEGVDGKTVLKNEGELIGNADEYAQQFDDTLKNAKSTMSPEDFEVFRNGYTPEATIRHNGNTPELKQRRVLRNSHLIESPAKFGAMDTIMSGVNILGAVGDYKAARRKGYGVISSAVRAGTQFAVYEALGAWALPVSLLQHAPGAVIKGADILYKENRKMNSAANFQVFGDAQFMDTQQLATMRQSGMEMAKMSQYNLQQTLMGNEATYLHR